jgi:hypothetical protein
MRIPVLCQAHFENPRAFAVIGVDGCDIIDNRGRRRILWARLGWKMNTGHCNRWLIAVAGALFELMRQLIGLCSAQFND